MQGTPSVSAPRQSRRRNWYTVIGAVAVILILVFLALLVSQPQWFGRESAVTISANPELSVYYRYAAEHPSLVLPSAENPELSAFQRYASRVAASPSLADNPEVRQFLNWQRQH